MKTITQQTELKQSNRGHNNCARWKVVLAVALAGWTQALQAQIPSNDQCSGAITLQSCQPTSFSSVGATSVGDPIPPCAPTGTNGVWFTYTPNFSGNITMYTCGSSYDTVLAVYHGTCGNLTEVQDACNDDSSFCGGSPPRQSSLTFAGTAGTKYYILVAGYHGATGSLSISVFPLLAISPAGFSPSALGGYQPVSVFAGTGVNCAWSVTNPCSSWVIATPTSGTGPGTVNVTVLTNTACAPRTCSLTIAGQTFTVNQAAGSGTSTLNPTDWNPGASGGSQGVSVTASGTNCTWSVNNPCSSWLTVAPMGGTGSGSVTVTAQANGNCSPRSCTLTIAGNSFYVTQSALNDTTLPVVTCPANIVANTDPGQCSKSNVTWSATATDNCPGVTVSCSPPSGSTFPKGVTTVVCTALDASGNTNTCSFTVTILDNEAPVLTCASNKTVQCASAWSFDPPADADACCGTNVTVTILSTVTNGSCPWVVTRTWLATDCNGNSNQCTQTVTLVDTSPPVLTCVSNKTVECDSAWTFDPPSAFDTCSGTNVTITILSTVTNGPACSEAITRSWQATDWCNNSATCSQTVTVQPGFEEEIRPFETAELVVASIEVDPQYPAPNEQTRVTVQLQNNGSQQVASNVLVELSIGGTTIGEFYQDLQPFGSATATFQWSPQYVGEYNLTAQLDPHLSVMQFCRVDDVLSKVVVVAETNTVADFGVESFQLVEHGGRTVGMQLTVSVNTNVTAATPVEVLDGDGRIIAVALAEFDGINPELQLDFPWPAEKAPSLIVARINPRGFVWEADPTNNVWQGEFRLPVDLAIEALSLHAIREPLVGPRRVTASFRVRNVGRTDVTELFEVRVLPIVNGVPSESLAETFLADHLRAGESNFFSHTFESMPHEFIIRAEVDRQHLLPDGNRNNNSVERLFANSIPNPKRWVALGPQRITSGLGAVGRIFHIAIEPTDRNTLYVGAPSGSGGRPGGSGVWKTTDGGVTWAPIADALPSLAVMALAVHPSVPGFVYLATHEGFYRSPNGGGMWERLGNAQGVGGYLIVHPDYPNLLFATTSEGIGRSEDGGRTWSTVLPGARGWNLVVDPINHDRLLATLFEPNDEAPSYTRVGVWESRFPGSPGTVPGDPATWRKLIGCPGGLLPVMTAYSQVYIAASGGRLYAGFQTYPAADERLFSLYRTTGISCTVGPEALWEKVWEYYTEGERPARITRIEADPSNPDNVYAHYVGGHFRYSHDGGMNFFEVSDMHMDHHGFAFDPVDSRIVYTGTDGGLYRSTDRGRAGTWAFVGEGILNVEIFDLATSYNSHTDPNLILIGTQDNGTCKTTVSLVWEEINGSDGATCGIDPTDPTVLYSMWQFAGTISRKVGSAANTCIGCGLSYKDGYNFPYRVHPLSDNGKTVIYAPYRGELRRWNGSTSCSECPNGNTEIGQPNNWPSVLLVPNEIVVRVGMDPSPSYNDGIIYAGTHRGNIFAAQDAAWGTNPTPVFPGIGKVNDIEVSPHSPVDVFVAFERWSGENRICHLRRRQNPTQGNFFEWTEAIGGNLPAGLMVRCIAVDPKITGDGPVFVGTTRGVWRGWPQTFSGSRRWLWESYNQGLPGAVDVSDLETVYSTRVLRAATLGRGAYEVVTDTDIPDLDIPPDRFDDETPTGEPRNDTFATRAIIPDVVQPSPILAMGAIDNLTLDMTSDIDYFEITLAPDDGNECLAPGTPPYGQPGFQQGALEILVGADPGMGVEAPFDITVYDANGNPFQNYTSKSGLHVRIECPHSYFPDGRVRFSVRPADQRRNFYHVSLWYNMRWNYILGTPPWLPTDPPVGPVVPAFSGLVPRMYPADPDVINNFFAGNAPYPLPPEYALIRWEEQRDFDLLLITQPRHSLHVALFNAAQEEIGATVAFGGRDTNGQATLHIPNLPQGTYVLRFGPGDFATSFYVGILGRSNPSSFAISLSGSEVVLSWPDPSVGWFLEETTALTPWASNTVWTAVEVLPVVVGQMKTVAIPIDPGQKFYRLRYIEQVIRGVSPGSGAEAMQVEFDFGTNALLSIWGRVVVDPRTLSEVTGITNGYINLVTRKGWAVQNLPVPPTNQPPLAVYFDLGLAQSGVRLDTIELKLMCSSQPVGEVLVSSANLDFTRYPVSIWEWNAQGVGPITLAVDPGPPPATVPIDKVVPIGQQTFARYQTVENEQTAFMQCVPMSMANSLQYLEDDGFLTVPHGHTTGLKGDNTLVGQLDTACDRYVISRTQGGGVWFVPMVDGKFKYLEDNNMTGLTHRHRGRGWGGVDERLPDGNYTSNGSTSQDDGVTITWDWIRERFYDGCDIEAVFSYDSGGGHAVRITGCGMLNGKPWIRYSHDSLQTDVDANDNKGIEDVLVWLSDDDNDGYLNFGSLGRELKFVFAECP